MLQRGDGASVMQMNVCVPMNRGIVPSVPVTAVPLQALQDNCSFSSLNRPGYKISQPTEGCDSKNFDSKLFETVVAGTAPSGAGDRLSVYLSELSYCLKPEREWKKKITVHLTCK